jgi:hypothetical protein
MNRRSFLAGIGSSILANLLIPYPAKAGLHCLPFSSAMLECQAGIHSAIAEITARQVGGQHLSQWCWAACIEMVFRYYGFNVPQEEIVSQTWGSIVNFPAEHRQILTNLNRQWIDRNGRKFRVYGDAYSAKPATAAQDLAENRPLIISSLGHATVLTGLRYFRDVRGNGHVTAAIVRDPWPGRGRRLLSAQEWLNAGMLVRIRVS